MWQADTPRQADTHTPGQTPPGQTATAADGTHPTGMHSCWSLFPQPNILWIPRDISIPISVLVIIEIQLKHLRNSDLCLHQLLVVR